jgi:Cytochrome P450
VLGSLLEVGAQPHQALQRLAREHGDSFLMRLGSVPTVVISHPMLIREAFAGGDIAGRWMNEVLGRVSHGGKDLAVADDGDHWRQLSRLSNQHLLSRRQLEHMLADSAAAATRLVEEVRTTTARGERARPVDLLSHVNARIVLRCIFGNLRSASARLEERYETLLRSVFVIFRNATSTIPVDYIPWLRFVPVPAMHEVGMMLRNSNPSELRSRLRRLV